MICKYHPHAELTSTLEDFQPNYAVGAGERIVRTRLRCSVIVDIATGRLCPFVDVLTDPDRVDRRFCTKCGKRLGEQSLGNSPNCNNCRSGHSNKKRKALSS